MSLKYSKFYKCILLLCLLLVHALADNALSVVPDSSPAQYKNDVESARLFTMLRSFSHLPDSELSRLFDENMQYEPSTIEHVLRAINESSLKKPMDIQPNTAEANLLNDIWAMRQQELLTFANGADGNDSGGRIDHVTSMKDLITKLENNYVPYVDALQNINSEKETDTFMNQLKLVLIDIESYVDHIDYSKDFHYLGGMEWLWKYIDAQSIPTNNIDMTNQKNKVTSLAVWCIGTMVKNNEQYQNWITEGSDVSSDHGNANLDMLVQLLLTKPSLEENMDDSLSVVELQKKSLYALSAVSSNNVNIKELLSNLQTPIGQILYDVLHTVTNDSTSDSSVEVEYSDPYIERTKKVFNYISDLIQEDIYAEQTTQDPESKNMQNYITPLSKQFCTNQWNSIISDHIGYIMNTIPKPKEFVFDLDMLNDEDDEEVVADTSSHHIRNINSYNSINRTLTAIVDNMKHICKV